jgi:hypothetical protein
MESISWRLRDKKGRRKRTAPRQPNYEESCEIQEKDLKILQFIRFCGGMQSTQSIGQWAKRTGLYNVNNDIQKPYHYIARRLKLLYHNHGVLERYEEQTRFEYMRRYYVDHKISPKGIALLKERGMDAENPFRATGSYLHQRMSASLYSSYLIQAMDNGIGFTHQHEITDTLPIETEAGILIPDGVFKLTFGDKEVLVFLEADRATEPGLSTDMKRKSWGKTIGQYQQVIGRKLYKKHYNVLPTCGAQVHVVTTVPSMQSKIIDNVARLYPQGCTYILVHTTNAFGMFFNPNTVLPVLSETWERYQQPAFRFV